MLGGPSALTSRTAVVGGGDAKEHHTLLMVLLQRCTPRQAGWVALGTLAQAFYEQEGAKETSRGAGGKSDRGQNMYMLMITPNGCPMPTNLKGARSLPSAATLDRKIP